MWLCPSDQGVSSTVQSTVQRSRADVLTAPGTVRPDIHCRRCSSPDTVRFGFTQRNAQRYLCRACGRTFIEVYAAPRTRFPADLISFALESYFEGSSLLTVARRVMDRFGVEPRLSTIHRWIVKYSGRASAMASQVSPGAATEWFAFQSVVSLQSGGGEKVWIWDIFDVPTMYLLGTRSAEQSAVILIEGLVGDVLRRSPGPPEVVRTFGLDWCLEPVRYYLSKRTRATRISYETSQQPPDTLASIISLRNAIVRTLASPNTLLAVVAGWVVDHNYMRQRPELGGRTPAEALGIKPPFSTWREVVASEPEPAG